jgi:uncharacterized protein (TIRG00374 family)
MLSRKAVLKIVKVLISLTLIVFVLTRTDLRKLWFTLLDMKIYYFILANVLNLVRVFISAYRWKILLTVKKITVGMNSLSTIYFIGIFFNMFLPTALGGDAARIYYLWKVTGEKMESTSSVVMERIIGFFVLGVICLGACFVIFDKLGDFRQKTLILIVTIVYLLGIIALFNSRLMQRLLIITDHIPFEKVGKNIRDFYASLHDFLRRKDIIMQSLILSLFYQVFWIVGVMFIAIGIGIEIDPVNYFVFLPIVMVVTMIPVSVSGIGVREGSFIMLFGLAGVRPAPALLLAFLAFSMAVILGILGGIVYAVKDVSLRKKEVSSELGNGL